MSTMFAMRRTPYIHNLSDLVLQDIGTQVCCFTLVPGFGWLNIVSITNNVFIFSR
ncbi:hypothetical protein LINPERHAP2_LOCUS9080 [Linum perenne]